MRNGIILQVQGLGVPVQIPSTRYESGFVIGWSTDVACPLDAPAHVLIGAKEVERFLKVGVDERFQQGDLIQLVPVLVEDGQQTISRQECIQKYNIDSRNWSSVRTAVVVSGNAGVGPVMNTIEWVGSREEYGEGAHLREAIQHARMLGMKAPAIFTPEEGGHLVVASDFMSDFRRQMNPSLRSAEIYRGQIEQAVCNMDFEQLQGERAIHLLREIQTVFRHQAEQSLWERQGLGIGPKHVTEIMQAEVPVQPAPRKTRGPSLH